MIIGESKFKRKNTYNLGAQWVEIVLYFMGN